MKTLDTTIMITIVLTLFLGGSTMAGITTDKGGEKSGESAKQCIQPSRIEDVDIMDNQTIVFHMYNHKSWVNKLPYHCPNLYHEGGFQYTRQLDELCSTDIITVINTYTKCGLGTFQPYTEPEDKTDS